MKDMGTNSPAIKSNRDIYDRLSCCATSLGSNLDIIILYNNR